MAGGILDEARKRLPKHLRRDEEGVLYGDYGAYGGIDNVRLLPRRGGIAEAGQTPEQMCVAQGGQWDPVNNQCIMPDRDSAPAAAAEELAPEDRIYRHAGDLYNQTDDPATAELQGADYSGLGYVPIGAKVVGDDGELYVVGWGDGEMSPYDAAALLVNRTRDDVPGFQGTLVKIEDKVKQYLGNNPYVKGITQLAGVLGLEAPDLTGEKIRELEEEIRNRTDIERDILAKQAGGEADVAASARWWTEQNRDPETGVVKTPYGVSKVGQGVNVFDRGGISNLLRDDPSQAYTASTFGISQEAQGKAPAPITSGGGRSSNRDSDRESFSERFHREARERNTGGGKGTLHSSGAIKKTSGARDKGHASTYGISKSAIAGGSTGPAGKRDAGNKSTYGLAGGGMVYRADGGTMHPLARGTDTVPAMLSEGEFVVDRDSAQRFGPELEKINNWEPTEGIEGAMSELDDLINHYAQGGKVRR